MEVSTTFPEMRNRRRKAQFDYECADEMNRLRLHPSSDLRQISSTNFWIRRWFQFSHGSSRSRIGTAFLDFCVVMTHSLKYTTPINCKNIVFTSLRRWET